MSKEKRKLNRSIFARLVTSFVVFLAGTLILYLIVVVAYLVFLGNGSIDNASPQNVIKNDGTINDVEVLNRVGGWVEELDDDGNVINIIGEKKTDNMRYSISELADLVDIGYVNYNSNGVVISQPDLGDRDQYSACARYAGDPKRTFLIFYPSDMVSYKAAYMLTNGQNGGSNGIFIVFLIIFVAEVVGISFYLKRHIDMPLKLLMSGMDDVSQGKRDVVLDYKTDREFENIRDRFNLMAQKLKESEDEKHRVEQSRNQMLLELAHDIKNPIASIKGSICALEEGLVSDDKKADYYRTIRMKAERITNLTNDMNTSLKMESDDYKLNLEKTDVCELVRRICVESYEELTSRGREFDIDIPEEPIMADIDPQLFSRVINNLLSNAGKYNVTGDSFAVSVSRDDVSSLSISVSDDGDPIDKEFVPRLFEAFSRADKTRKTDGGTGLGLAISRKIMEKHGGTLEYKRSHDRNVFIIKLAA
jgi:signal transduction histidine kinase